MAAGSRHYSRCRVSPSPRGAEVIRISLKCAPEGSGFSMRGRVYLKHGRLLRGVIDRLAVGHETAPANLEVSAGNLEQTAEGSRLTLGLLKDGLQARMPDGDALRSLAGRPAVIISFLQGISPRRVDVRHCGPLGRALAKMHLAAEGFPLVRPNALSLPGWRPLFDAVTTP